MELIQYLQTAEDKNRKVELDTGDVHRDLESVIYSDSCGAVILSS